MTLTHTRTQETLTPHRLWHLTQNLFHGDHAEHTDVNCVDNRRRGTCAPHELFRHQPIHQHRQSTTCHRQLNRSGAVLHMDMYHTHLLLKNKSQVNRAQHLKGENMHHTESGWRARRPWDVQWNALGNHAVKDSTWSWRSSYETILMMITLTYCRHQLHSPHVQRHFTGGWYD